MSDDVIEKIFADVIKPKIEGELQGVGEKLASILNNLSFLFNSNKELLLTLIVDHYIQEYDKDNNSFTLDFKSFSENTPKETKERLFEFVITQFTKTINLTSLDKDHLEKEPADNSNSFEQKHDPVESTSELKDQLPM